MFMEILQEKKVAFDCFVKTKTPKVVVVTSTRTEADWLRMKNYVDGLVEGIKEGIFLPADPASWACGEQYCGYWNMCECGGKKINSKIIDIYSPL